MENIWVEESGRQDEEAATAARSSDCCTTYGNYEELVRCTSDVLLKRRVDSDGTLVLDSGLLTAVTKCTVMNSLERRFLFLDDRIPKQMGSLDEQYLRQWLEFMCSKTSKVMPFEAPFDLASSAVAGDSELRKKLAIQCVSRPPEARNSNVDSPLSFHGLGIAATDPKSSGLIGKNILQSPFYVIDAHSASPVLRGSLSSSTSSGQECSSGVGGSVSQGMLLFGCMDGMPRFIFSLDEHHEVYVADLTRVQPLNQVDPDYKYLIRLDEHDRKGAMRKGSCFVGEIIIATSTTVCLNDTEIRTTEFVLFGGYEIPADEEGSISTTKSNRFPSKAVKAFAGLKPRDKACRGRITEGIAVDSFQDKLKAVERHRQSGNELAAVIVKNQVEGPGAAQTKPEVWGWGLNFLRKIEAERGIKNFGECSGSMDVIIPAGLHGMPRTTSIEGPSSLIERWKSGGKCDCGGWDLGCPLTLLEARSNELAGDMRHMDLIVGGSNTMLRVTNVRDGLFLVRFNESLTALKSLSVAIAYIHAHTPFLPHCFRA